MTRALHAGLSVLLLLLSACARPILCSAPAGEANVVSALRDPELRLRWPIAHRGDRNSGPDNSRESIVAAAKYGVPIIEVDVRFSADGTPFLFHDRTLRPENSQAPPDLLMRPVAGLRNEDIARIRLPMSGEPLLYFSEALEEARPFKSVLELDIKGETPERIDMLMMLAYEARLADKLVVQCQKLETLAYMREHFPDIAVAARVRSLEEIELALAYRPEIIFAKERVLAPQVIEKIQNAGSKAMLIVMGKDTDTVQEWERLFDSGTDILMTDHGNKMMYYIREKFCPNGT